MIGPYYTTDEQGVISMAVNLTLIGGNRIYVIRCEETTESGENQILYFLSNVRSSAEVLADGGYYTVALLGRADSGDWEPVDNGPNPEILYLRPIVTIPESGLSPCLARD